MASTTLYQEELLGRLRRMADDLFTSSPETVQMVTSDFSPQLFDLAMPSLRSRDQWGNIVPPPGFHNVSQTQMNHVTLQACELLRNLLITTPASPYPDMATTAIYDEPHKQFMPTRMTILDQLGVKELLSAEGAEERQRSGIALTYRGDIHNTKNLSAEISDDQNVSFFITGLPLNCTVGMLLRTLHGKGVGRIYFTHINPPVENFRGGRTCAAKLTFFDVESAQRFWNFSRNGFRVEGTLTKVVRNRIKVAEIRHGKEVTRILVISGPKNVVKWEFLGGFFSSKFKFQLEGPAQVLGETEAHRTLLVPFGSYRSQAEAAVLYLKDTREVFEGVTINFDGDPCAAVEART